MESATRATAPPAMGIEWSPEIACKHCDMKFGSAQALGGHQNAHKVDREVAKRLRHAEFTGGRVTNVPERRAVESCTEEGTVGLCVWCMKSAPLKLCVNRPSASEIAWMMRNYRNIAQGPQQSGGATAVKWSGGSINVGSLGTRSGAAVARKYYGVENDEARAAALAARKYYKKDIYEARAAAVAARKYYEKKNDETRASAVARGSSKRVVEELDLTLRL